MCLFLINKHIFRHLKLEIATAISSFKCQKIETNFSAGAITECNDLTQMAHHSYYENDELWNS